MAETIWELINKTGKSVVLFFLMGCCLVAGYLLGAACWSQWRATAYRSRDYLAATINQFFAGDSIVLGISGAQEVTPDIHPQLSTLSRDKDRRDLLAMPKVYIIDSAAPNAFATGRNRRPAP
jgi:heat shock protein HtpX